MKLVREHIFEKFSEEGDPIQDMGIGGYSFDTLNPGAIIHAIVPKLSLKYDNSGYFTSYDKGINLPINHPILVYSVRNYIIPGTKEITLYILTESIEELRATRETFISTGRLIPAWGSKIRMIISEKKFNKLFKVIEKGVKK